MKDFEETCFALPVSLIDGSVGVILRANNGPSRNPVKADLVKTAPILENKEWTVVWIKLGHLLNP